MSEEARVKRILFASSEAEPFYKVGGLGDYAGSLPVAIKDYFYNNSQEIDFRVVIPLHNKKTIRDFDLQKVSEFQLQNTSNINIGTIYQTKFKNILWYFISQDSPAPESDDVYGFDQYQTAYKFAFFSLAVENLILNLDWYPQIIHTNDWHTALINHQVKHHRNRYKHAKSILTIHNMPFMGYGSEPIYKEFGIESVSESTFPTWASNLPLPMGIASADKIVAVSPTYAEELKTNNFAYGLEEYFIQNSKKIAGIINGIDVQAWDPLQDKKIAQPFSVETISLREKNKKALFSEIGFDYDSKEPLLIVISRLENQKGIDLILDALSNTANKNWKAVILGSGHYGYEHAFRALERVFPRKIRAFMEYNANLARKLYASGDMILMPSLYEPCGLSQMIAMHYGCVPIAHAVGGLKDSIIEEPASEQTGFLFQEPTKQAFIPCVEKAIQAFENREKWLEIQNHAMLKDFSWKISAANYVAIYDSLL